MEISHLLSLKVMRVSKPSMAPAAQPFFSTSPALSAHASASLLSLQGTRPLPGHPKTLRDFSLTELLTLPSTFGAISLGETFSSAFCINNECDVEVSGVHLRMEIQTTTTKLLLAEFGGLEKTLKPGEPLEGVISHEIKELNQHVLACTVSYLLPDSLINNHNAGPPENPERPNLRVFRKYYKFTVSNPLSVKTKVHVPRSPTALMSKTEREKVFLEVHVQNLTSEPLCFERMKLDCVEGWSVEDANLPSTTSEENIQDSALSALTVFSGSMGIMQPQDTRQYLFILSPKPEATPEFPVVHQPGSVIPLGRLDISWRTGRLLTSVLSRRIPLLPIPPPAPAIPPHLQQSPRPQSPGPNAYRPSSPAFRVRNQPTARPQSPGTSHSAMPSSSTNPQHIPRPDVDVDLVINSIPYDEISVEQPFSIDFTLTVSALLPSTAWPRPGAITPAQASVPRDRILSLVVQHTLPPRSASISQSLANALQQPNVLPPTPEPKSPPPPAPYALRRSLSTMSLTRRSDSTAWGDPTSPSIATESGAATPIVQSPTVVSHDDQDRADALRSTKTSLPSPFRIDAVASGQKPGQLPEPTEKEESAMMFLGSSVLKLPAFRLLAANAPSTPSQTPKTPDMSGDGPTGIREADSGPRALASANFSLTYVALREGFCPIGGLRVLLVEDREVPVDGELEQDNTARIEPKVVKEWDSVGEVWAKGLSS